MWGLRVRRRWAAVAPHARLLHSRAVADLISITALLCGTRPPTNPQHPISPPTTTYHRPPTRTRQSTHSNRRTHTHSRTEEHVYPLTHAHPPTHAHKRTTLPNVQRTAGRPGSATAPPTTWPPTCTTSSLWAPRASSWATTAVSLHLGGVGLGLGVVPWGVTAACSAPVLPLSPPPGVV